jgi:acid ceramidase
MKVWGVVLAVVVVWLELCTAIDPDEPCVTSAYPPDPNTEVPTYTVDLDQDPKLRWQKLVTDKKDDIVKLMDYVKWLLSFIDDGKLIPAGEEEFGRLVDTLPSPYGDELRGINQTTGLPLGDIVLYNVFYEIFSVCTSIIGQTEDGTLMHARNLDFGLLMGWDIVNNTWPVAEMLRPIVVNVEYMKGGKLLYTGIHFAGYIGILSALKPNMFTLTMNERFALEGGYIGILEWLAGMRNESWMGFLTRDTMEKATTFSEAVTMLAGTPMLAPAYFIVAGTKSGEGSIITRSLDKAIDIWNLNPSNGTWFILETNYDHWKAPLVIDNRRGPANKCMEKMGQKALSLPGLFNVLSTRPVLNKLTTYTTLMQVKGYMKTYTRECPDPCWPF